MGQKTKKVSNLGAQKKPTSAGETPTMCVNMFSAEGGGERGDQMTAGLFSEAACLAEWRYWVEAAGRPAGGRTVALLNVHPLNALVPPAPPPIGRHTRQLLFIYLFLIIRFFCRSVCTHPSVIICPELCFARTHAFLLVNEMLQHVGNHHHHHHHQLPPPPLPWKACGETMVALSWLLSSAAAEGWFTVGAGGCGCDCQ